MRRTIRIIDNFSFIVLSKANVIDYILGRLGCFKEVGNNFDLKI